MRKSFFIIVFLVNFVFAGTGKNYEVFVITNTGTTAINFSKISQEIYVVAMSTNTAYVNFVATTTTTSNFVLGQLEQTDIIEHTEEVASSKMGITQSVPPVNIRVMIKYW